MITVRRDEMKRFVSIFVVFVLIVTSVFATAGIAYGCSGDDNDIEYPVEGGNLYFDEKTGTITGCDTSVTEAVIPDKINGVEVTSIEDGAFAYCRALTSIEMPDEVVNIGNHAFEECISLRSIKIPAGVTSIGYGTFFGCTSLKTVSLNEGLEEIGDSIFSKCTSLETVSLNEGLKKIGGYAFDECTSLKSIFIPSTVDSIADWAFNKCKSLADIQVHKDNKIFEVVDDILYATGNQFWKRDIPDVGNIRELIRCSTRKSGKVVIDENVGIINRAAFSGCSQITDIIVENDDDRKSVNGILYDYIGMLDDNDKLVWGWNVQCCPEGKTGEIFIEEGTMFSFGNAFENCVNITGVNIPDSVQEIGYATFKNCRNLRKATIGEGVREIGQSAFEECSSLREIVIPDSVKSIGGSAFSDCNSLRNVIIEDGVEEINYDAFENCSSLREIVIPGSVKSLERSIFSGCSNLSKVTLEYGIEKVSPYTFFGCVSLAEITIPGSVKKIEDHTFYHYDDGGNYVGNLNKVTLGYGVESIGECAFYGNEITELKLPGSLKSIGDQAFYSNKLNKVTIPEGVTSIGEGAFEENEITELKLPNSLKSIGAYAFEDNNLTKVVIPEGVTSMGEGAFASCSSLRSIEILNGVTSIGEYAFRDCGSLRSIEIPKTVTHIGAGAFYNCSSLRSIEIPKTVTHIGAEAFYNCSSLRSIEIPNSVMSIGESAFSWCSSLRSIEIPDGITRIEDAVFQGCSTLRSIRIPEGVTSIGDVAFRWCSSLTSMKLPKGVTNIGSDVFSNCSSLRSIEIPDRVTSIEMCVFSGCSSLTSIKLPDGVTSIGYFAFRGCSSLTSIIIPTSVTEIGFDSFENHSDDLVIYGYTGSYAETYAEDYGIKFVAYDGKYKESVPKGKYGIFVIDSRGKAIKGADVEFGSHSGVTDGNGLALFPKWTDGTPLIKVSCDGYVSYSNEDTDYEKSSDAYDVITLYKTSEANLMLTKAMYKMGRLKEVNLLHNARTVYKPSSADIISSDSEFSLTCTAKDANAASRYELWQNNKKIDESDDGRFKSLRASMFDEGKGVFVKVYNSDGRAVSTHINLEFAESDTGSSEIEIGQTINITIKDDVPLLGGHQMKVDLFKKLPFKVKVSDDTCYFGLNVGNFEETDPKEIRKNLQLLKEINKLELNKNNSKSLKNLIAKAETSAKPDFDIQVVGYGECKLGKNGKLASEITLYLGIQASVELSKQWTHVAAVVPVTVHLDAGLETEAGGKINIDRVKSQLTGDIVLKVTPKASLFLGVGVGKLASAGGYGSASLEAESVVMGSSPNGLNYINADLEAGIKYYFFGMENKDVLAHGKYNLYTRASGTKTLSMLPQTEEPDYDLYRAEDLKKHDLSYIAGKSEWFGNTASAQRKSRGISQSSEIKNLITTAYENSTPSVVSDGETMIMAYLDADVSRGANNATVVEYSIYDESTGTWGEPVKLDSNDTADYQPQLYLIGQDIYLTYQDCSNVYGDDDNTRIEDLVKQQNIRTAKFNRQTRMFEIVNTVDAADKYRSCQTAGTMNGAAVTAWVESSGGDIFNQNDTNEIWYSTYDGTSWNTPEKEITGAKCVTALAVTESGIAYVSDMDMDLNTDGDKVLYIGQKEIDSGRVSELKVCDGIMMWTNDGILKKYEENTVSTVFDDISILGEFVLAGNTLYYTVAGEGCANIYGRKYDAASESWSEAVRITSGDRYIEYLSAAELNGNLYAAFTDTKVTITTTVAGNEEINDIIRECNLSWCRLEEVTDLTVEDAEYDSAAVVLGGKVPVSVTVRNSGSSAIDTADVTVTDESGDTVYESAVNMDLAAGASKQIEVPVAMGETISEHTYSISVNVNGDRNTDDNSIDTVIGYTDLELECEQVQVGDIISLYMTVTNRSYAPSSGRLEITCGDKCTYTADVPVLEYGESSTSVANLSEIALSDGSSGQIRVEAVADAAEDETYNNYELVYLDLDYDITYYAQAGDENTFAVESKTYDEYAEITEDEPVRDGYRFLGWSTDSEAGEAEYTAGDSISSNRNLTLYGIWQESRVYTVSGNITSYSDKKAVVKVYEEDTEKEDIIDPYDDIVTPDEDMALPYEVSVGTPVSDGDTYTQEYSVALEAGNYVIAVYIPGYGIHMENIKVTDSEVTGDVKLYLLGDANGDGKVRIGDKAVLARYIAEWKGYDKLLNEEAADINGDGRINAADRMLLERHLAGWSRYKVLEYGMNTGEY